MKKKIFILVFSIMQLGAFAQNPFVGMWEGKITAGMDIKVIFTIRQDESKKFTATMDVPGQGIKEMTASEVVVSNDSIVISIKEFGGSYAGKQTDGSTIQGEWRQGINTALQLKKIENIQSIRRPQTPVPPFPYKSEDIIYTNKDKTIRYGATITIPDGNGPFPAIVLITGSGQQNRDEEVAYHKPFAVIADHLTRNGFIVLRVDDRGMGQTTGEVHAATTLDFSEDVSVGIDYLKNRKEVDKKRIALLGHSEGGMIAQILASTRTDIAAIVLLAAPGKRGDEVLTEQNRELYTLAGLPKEYVNSYIELYSRLIAHANGRPDSETVKTQVVTQVEEWLQKTPKNIVVATTGIIHEESKAKFIKQFTDILSVPWIQYFVAYDPAHYVEKITCPVFALNGSRDVQIVSKANLAAIETALKNGKSNDYQIKEYEGLNHLFQKCKTCTIKEYGDLDETISVEVLQDIASWLTSKMPA